MSDITEAQSRTLQHGSVWVSAISVGLCAVLFAKAIALVQSAYLSWFSHSPLSSALISPLLFVLSAAIVRKTAPNAKGSGIPQVLKALDSSMTTHGSESTWRSPLISIRTALFKVISALVAIAGGASIGREGPTVQISASVFAAIGRLTKKRLHRVELKSLLTAGAAAGVAAAFNTPLAGITFAIEDIIDGSFSSFRQTTMLAVIASGITAQALLGDYLFFGFPTLEPPNFTVVYQAIAIGALGGVLGGIFARILAYPKLTQLPTHWIWRALICGSICSIIGILSHGATAGSGYEATEKVLTSSNSDSVQLLFPVLKLVTTILSYLSGIAGGIFSPSLSIGAGIGLSFAKLFHLVNFKTCALLGMVAFFTAVVQAPLTAVIIVTEMTDRHILILPFMIAALVSQTIGKRIMPTPLYHHLAKHYDEPLK